MTRSSSAPPRWSRCVRRNAALERRLAEADTPEALAREARRLGYVKPGERLFIVKGIDAWRRAQALKAKRTDRR